MQRRPLFIVKAVGLMQLLALLLPMLPGVVAAQWLQLYRPWFWAEFLVLVALTRGRPWLFALGLALLWSADFLFIFAQINLSSSYADVLDLLSYIPHTNVTWIMAGIAGLFVLLLWGAVRAGPPASVSGPWDAALGDRVARPCTAMADAQWL